MATNTQRTKKKLEDEGYIVDVTEYWNAFAKKRHDLFTFGDLVAVREDKPFLIVQTTSKGNMSSRRKKILESNAAYLCLMAGLQIEVWGWFKVKGRWQVAIRPVYLSDFIQ